MSLILALSSLVIMLICMVAHRHITMMVGLVPLMFLAVADFASGYPHNYWFIISLVASIAWVIFKMVRRDYDFSRKILSVTPNLNRNLGRKIGKVLPYTNRQLKYNNSTVVQTELASKGGTLICGSSGSGKTYGMLSTIKQDLADKKSVVFVDFKGDTSILDDITDGIDPSIPVYKLSYDGCDFTYDPLANLDEAGRVEAILNMRKWSLDGSDEHYRSGTQLFLQKAIGEYNHKGGNYLVGFYEFLRKYNVERHLYDAYTTTMKLVELTITSKVSSMFTGDDNEFRFDESEQFLLLVSFTSSTKALATSITSLMFKDLMEVGTRNPYDPMLCLYVDEFGSCENAMIIKDILEKGRSCGIATTLSMQDINQLVITTSSEPFLDSVLGTLNNYIIYAGATKTTAEKLAGVQIAEIENLLMSLKKPIEGRPPTCIYISKYPVFDPRKSNEVYRVIPFDFKKEEERERKKESSGVKPVVIAGIASDSALGLELNVHEDAIDQSLESADNEQLVSDFDIDDFV